MSTESGATHCCQLLVVIFHVTKLQSIRFSHQHGKISMSPSKTILAAPATADFNVHSPTFYVGVSIGAIISVGLIAAFVALVDTSSVQKRRRARTVVPWGRSGYGDGGGLEAGLQFKTVSIDVNTAGIWCSQSRKSGDLAHVQTWSPGGDRDVGEPRRAKVISVVLSTACLISVSLDGIITSTSLNNYPTKRPGSTQIRHLPSHLVADDVVARHQRGMYCDPRGSRDAFFSGNDHGPRRVGRRREVPALGSLHAERLRNLGKSTSNLVVGNRGPCLPLRSAARE